MRRLWIFGDSFSRGSAEPRTWPNQLSRQLDCELVNVSLRGASADWILRQYLTALAEIQPDDPVVVLFTSPNRFWFYEDQPDLTNPAILDFRGYRDRGSAEAAQNYFRYLQRPELDLQWTYYRAVTISHETQRLSLRRPLIIRCFPQDVSAAETFDTVTWAQGTLSDLQFGEYQDPDAAIKEIAERGRDHIFRGTDCRYNHLCLDNHDVVAGKISDYFLRDLRPDFTEGFRQRFLGQDWIKDSQFCQTQLDPSQISIYQQQNLPKNLFKSLR